MSHLIQPLTTLLIGIAMTIYGIAHAVMQFPDPVAFTQLMANLPAFSSVLLFILGLLAFAAGIVLVVMGVRNMRRRWRRFGQIARHVESQPQYADDDGGWGQAYR